MKKFFLLATSALIATGAFAQEAESNSPYVINVNCTEPADLAGSYTVAMSDTGAKNGEFPIYSGTFNLDEVTTTKAAKYFFSITDLNNPDETKNTIKYNAGNSYLIQPNTGSRTITFSLYSNAKGLQVAWSISSYGLSDANRRALAYFPGSTSGESCSAYFNNALDNAQFKGMQGNKGSTINYIVGSNADIFTFTPNQKWPAGIYKTTLDYKTMNFFVEPASNIDVEIKDFCTFVAPADVKLPNEVEAFTLKYNPETPEVLDAVKIEGQILAANTPVVLKASVNGVYTLEITGTASYTLGTETTPTFINDATTEGNVLVGVFQPHNIIDGTENNGVYPFENGTFNLWDDKDSTDGKGKVTKWQIVYPFTAYAALPADVTERPENLSVKFPDNTETGIENVILGDEEAGQAYNLFGMPVDESFKGIVVRNGKKYIQR